MRHQPSLSLPTTTRPSSSPSPSCSTASSKRAKRQRLLVTTRSFSLKRKRRWPTSVANGLHRHLAHVALSQPLTSEESQTLALKTSCCLTPTPQSPKSKRSCARVVLLRSNTWLPAKRPSFH